MTNNTRRYRRQIGYTKHTEARMDIPQHPERLQVKIDEAARILGYSRATVYNLITRGEIKTIGKGRLRRVAVAELMRWQKRNEG